MTDKKLNKTVMGTSLLVLSISLLIITGAAKALFTYSGATGSAQKVASIEAFVSHEQEEGDVREVFVENKGTVDAKAKITFSINAPSEGNHEDLINKASFNLGKDWVKVSGAKGHVYEYNGTVKAGEQTTPIKVTLPNKLKLNVQASLEAK